MLGIMTACWITDRRMLWTAGLASSVVVLALVVALVVGAFSGSGYCS